LIRALWAILLFQQSSLDLHQSEIPPAMQQLAVAIGIIFLALKVSEKLQDMINRNKKDLAAAPALFKIELKSDPTVEFRLGALDRAIESKVERREFEDSRRETREQLSSINTKLDRMWGSRSALTGERISGD